MVEFEPATNCPNNFKNYSRTSGQHIYGRVGDSLPNEGFLTPKVQGGVNGYLSVM